MKRTALCLLVVLSLLLSFSLPALAGNPNANTIPGGQIVDTAGNPVTTGFNPYGYNYQAHLFAGSYFNVYAAAAGFPPYEGDTTDYLAANPLAATFWAWPYRDVQLNMKWNDAWISNKDLDGDHLLDRHPGYASYIGSGAWETNHMWGVNDDGTTFNDFVKIVAVPADAVLNNGIWYTADGTEIGADIWGQFAIILEVYNDHDTGDHGLLTNPPAPAGFGFYK